LYSPEIGRFLTPDTFPGSVFEPRSLHKYVYCNANPVDNIDPAGLFGFSIGGLVMVSAIVGILASISAMSYSHYLGRTRAEIAKAGATWFLIGAGVTATVYAVAWGGYLVFIYAATGGITYSQQVYQAFERGQCYVVRLTQDLQVYRWFGGPTGSPTATNPGRWWTPSLFQSSAEAVEYLAVNPAWGNTAEHMATGIIPKGTQILIGYAASQGGLSGGAVQIYTSVVQLLTK
jgi:hypothetical protein